MKMSEIKEMTDAELDHQYDEILQERLNLSIQAKTGQLQNSARLNQIRKDVARIKTEKNDRARRLMKQTEEKNNGAV